MNSNDIHFDHDPLNINLPLSINGELIHSFSYSRPRYDCNDLTVATVVAKFSYELEIYLNKAYPDGIIAKHNLTLVDGVSPCVGCGERPGKHGFCSAPVLCDVCLGKLGNIEADLEDGENND